MDSLHKSLLLKKFKMAEASLNEETSTEEAQNEELDGLAELHSFAKKSTQRKSEQKLTVDKHVKNLPQWSDFFAHSMQLEKNDYNFQIYFQLPDEIDDPAIKTYPILIFHHGAGSSGLTFAQLCSHLNQSYQGRVGYLVYDARGHGQTEYTGEDSSRQDFSLSEFIQDEYDILEDFYHNKVKPHFHNDTELLSKVKLLLVGHSLGGSIATFLFDHISKRSQNEELYKKIMGVVMLDIVEEAAIAALNTMDRFLAQTPHSFEELSDAIDWHVVRGMPHKRNSAEISVPPLFNEEIERVTNLKVFERYWGSWFTGLSSKFVEISTSKLLILAGNENLDKELIVGQMQGKYQLVVFQKSGHFIQEDCPRETAITLQDFIQRNDNRSTVIKSNWGSVQK
ncbi:hypothetical protein ACO0QE_000516 [Hanseniaspora vineae]